MPFEDSPSWFDLLKLSGGDGTVSHFRGYGKFSDSLFRDSQTPKDPEGFLFEIDGRTIVVARPHFEAQVKNKSRVLDETKYPLSELVAQINKINQRGRNFYSFVSAGEKDANGRGNVDAVVRYSIIDGSGNRGNPYIDGSNNSTLTIGDIVSGKGGTIRYGGGSQINRPKKIIRLDSVHGWNERFKVKDSVFINLWQPTWGVSLTDNAQLVDRAKRLGGN